MNDDSLSTNFEWKKKGFDKKERPSRKNGIRKENIPDSDKKNKIVSPIPLTDSSNVSFNSHLKKMRKRIKQALDEEDEDEDEYENVIAIPVFAMEEQFENNQLYNGLSDSEKQIIEQSESMQQIKRQQNASKLAAMVQADTLAKNAGLPGLSAQAVAENMQNAGWQNDAFKRAIKNYIAPDLKIKDSKLNPEKTKQLLSGLKRLQKLGGIHAVRGMKVDDVIKLTDKKYNDKHIAQTVLKKTGRKLDPAEDKRQQRKQQKIKTNVSFMDLLQSKQQDRTFTKA